MKYSIDFYKMFNLVPPMCGLIDKVTSPKGIRRQEEDGYISYQLHSDLCCIYKGEATDLEPRLYWVLDVGLVKGTLNWNQYLFIIEDDGTVYPVGEYLDQKDSSWVKKAIGTVKKYFAKEPVDAIEITKIDYKIHRKSKWGKTKK